MEFFLVSTFPFSKGDYGDKSKKKKGETAQNKDMKRALDIANHYMESKILK